MKNFASRFLMISIIIGGCQGGPRSAEEAQSDPAATAETIFYLVQNEKYDALPALIDEEADANSKEFTQFQYADKAKQAEIREYFASASLNGDPVTNGDKATVKVKLGHKGTFDETFGMVKRNGKWYLSSSSF